MYAFAAIFDCFSSEIDVNRWRMMFFGWDHTLEKILRAYVELPSLDLLENFISISSRLRPWVSGSIVRAKTAPSTPAAPSIHIVNSRPTMAFRSGYILIAANVNICAMLVVRPPRLPLNLSGYNSEVITHGNVRKPIMEAPTWVPMQSNGTHDGSSNLGEKVVLPPRNIRNLKE